MVTVIFLPDYDPMLKGLTFYVIYLFYFQLTEFYWGRLPLSGGSVYACVIIGESGQPQLRSEFARCSVCWK